MDKAVQKNAATINANMFGAAICAAGAWYLRDQSWYGWVLLAAMLTAFVAVMLGKALVTIHTDWKVRRTLHRMLTEGSGAHTARWATEAEMEAAGMFDGIGRPLGITAGNRAIFEPHRLRPVHSKVMATSGAGKTTGAVVPAIMHLALSPHRPSIVAFDIKGELTAQCAGPLLRAGIEVWVCDDCGTTPGLKPTRLNPFGPLVAAVADGSPDAAMLARLIANTFEPEPEGDGKNKYFRDGTRDFLRFGPEILARTAPEDCTPSGVWQLLSSDELLDMAFEKAEAHGGAIGTLAKRLMEKRTENASHFSDARNTALQKLEVYEEGGRLWQAGEQAVKAHADIRQRQVVVFLVAGLAHLKDTKPHHILQLSNFLHVAKRPGHPVEFIIDEFSSAPVAGLVEDLTIIRQFGNRVMMVAQAESEIERQFTQKSARTINALTAIKQILGVSDAAEAKRVSDALGRGTYATISLQEGGDGLQSSMADQGRPLMTPDEVLAMPRNEQIIFCDSLRPIRARKLYQNEIAPMCEMLDPNPLENNTKLPSRPRVAIDYGDRS